MHGKLFVLIVSAMQLFGLPVAGQTVRPLDQKTWAWILNDARVIELGELPQGDVQWLSARLFELPIVGSCIEAADAICGYRYFLAVTETGEAPAQAVFDLGHHGELVPLEWAGRVAHGAPVRLRLQEYPYPRVMMNRFDHLRGEPAERWLEMTVLTATLR